MSAPTAPPSPAGLPGGEIAGALAGRYAKTEAGRSEIRLRALPLSRPARNLLLIIDPSRSAAEWLGLVQGSDQAALQALHDAGLIANTGHAVAGGPRGQAAPAATGPAAASAIGPAGTPPAPNTAAVPARMSLAQALEHRSYRVLYDRITAEARPRLGLIKGYKMILEVERCSGPPEVRALAQRFVDQVRDADGDTAGMALAQVLIAPE